MAETSENPDVIWIEEPEMGFWEMTFLPAIVEGLKSVHESGHGAAKSRITLGSKRHIPVQVEPYLQESPHDLELAIEPLLTCACVETE